MSAVSWCRGYYPPEDGTGVEYAYLPQQFNTSVDLSLVLFQTFSVMLFLCLPRNHRQKAEVKLFSATIVRSNLTSSSRFDQELQGKLKDCEDELASRNKDLAKMERQVKKLESKVRIVKVDFKC